MNQESIPTGCGPLDDLLGGGFERGTVTQVYGPPAAGKTNVALGAAVEVAAAGGTAVYIDTEGLSLARFEQVAEARVDAASGADRNAVNAADEDAASGADENGADDVAELTSRIVVKEAFDFEEQEEAVRDTAELAARADLVVLDSATGFYRLKRSEDEEGGEALREVASQVTHLLSLARKHDLAVVLTNQVYTDPDSDRTRPLGGHTLEHWTGTVVRIERFRGGNRRATLEKHRARPAGEKAQFRITDSGIEGVEDGMA